VFLWLGGSEWQDRRRPYGVRVEVPRFGGMMAICFPRRKYYKSLCYGGTSGGGGCIMRSQVSTMREMVEGGISCGEALVWGVGSSDKGVADVCPGIFW